MLDRSPELQSGWTSLAVRNEEPRESQNNYRFDQTPLETRWNASEQNSAAECKCPNVVWVLVASVPAGG